MKFETGMRVQVTRTVREGREGHIVGIRIDDEDQERFVVEFPNGARHVHHRDDLRPSDAEAVRGRLAS